MFVQLYDAVYVYLARGRIVERLTVWCEVDGIQRRLAPEPLQEPLLDLGLRDERLEGGAVARLDVRDERGGVVSEFALRDELPCR